MASKTKPLAAPECVAVALGVAAFFSASARASSGAPDYPIVLAEALGRLESGEYSQARLSLQQALAVDCNDPCGLLALAVYALHTGDGKRAELALRRAQEQEPENFLIPSALALAKLLQNDLSGAQPYAKSSPLLGLYVRLMAGDKGVAAELADVKEDEGDPLRLELAGIAALRAGDTARGSRLLKALMARPEWMPCEESHAVTLPFVERRLAEGSAGTSEPINLPAATAATLTLTGQVTLTPGTLPEGTASVNYQVPATYNAATNSAPYIAQWNTTRLANGLYTLTTTAHSAQGKVLSETRRMVRIANTPATPSSRLTPDQREAMDTRLQALLAPQPSRKAAHYALAEWAVRSGNSAEALARIESVVAIDPQFRSAYGSLKEYNKKYVGIGNGYWRGQTRGKLIALTLDDGPNPLKHRTPALLDTLRNLDIKATFFIVGARAEANPELIRRMDTEGHEIANHSYTHPNLTFLTPDTVRKELCRTSVVVRELTGKRPRFYRPPGGNFNGAIADAASALGMHGAYWTVDAFKFEYAPFTPADTAAFVLKKVKPGTILLMHNAPDNTIAALPQIVNTLRSQGYEFVTMSELVQRSKPSSPTKP